MMLEDSINQFALAAAIIILALTVGVVSKYVKQMKDDTSKGELADESWDGIKEYKNELPTGWAISFLITIFWGLWYWFFGYPLNAYSQIGEYNEEVNTHTEKFQKEWAKADNETLKNMGKSLFLVQCAPCHGVTGEGMNNKAANLANWGHEAGIMNTIKHGGKGLNYSGGEMPAGLADEVSAKAIASYVMAEISAVKKTAHPELVTQGKEMYNTLCASCHGEDGTGMFGTFPDLTKYGTNTFTKEVLEKGKVGHIGHMPSFKDMLNSTQQEAVSTYILSIGQN